MGTCTKGFIPNVSSDELKYFASCLDPETSIQKGDYHDVYLMINISGNNRNMHCSRLAIDTKKYKKIETLYKTDKEKYKSDLFLYGDSESYAEDGIPEKTSGYSLSLGANDQAIDIITMFCLYFGGYFMEYDTDSAPFRYIEKDLRKIIILPFEGRLYELR